MPNSRRYSKRKYRRYNKTKRGGENTDTLDALEQGILPKERTVPSFIDPRTIRIPQQPITPNEPNAVEFFEKASKGMEAQSKIEAAEAERKRREEIIKNAPNITAAELFSGLPPERKKSVMDSIEEYSSSEMDPIEINLYGIGKEKGGRKSRRYRRKGRKSRRHRKSRKH